MLAAIETPQTSSWLVDQINSLAHAAQLETNSLRETAARINAMWARANNEPDPERAAWMKVQIRPVNAHHNQLAAYWTAVRDKVNATLDGARKFLDSIGVTGNVPNQLGQVQLIVPAVLVSLVLLAWAAVNYLHPQNEAHLRAVQLAEKLLADTGTTPAQRQQIIDAIQHEISTKPDTPDPLGISGSLKAALPIVLVIGAFILLRPLLKSFGARRRLAAA
jgi:hypothetical protein